MKPNPPRNDDLDQSRLLLFLLLLRCFFSSLLRHLSPSSLRPPLSQLYFPAMRRLLTLLFLLCPIAAAQQKPSPPIPGQVELHRPCAAKPAQTYALYVPATYTASKKWPIVYAFDPSARGDRPIDALKSGAEKYGYIVAASNNSRNGPWPPQIEAAQAVSDDTRALLSIDDRRIHFAGLSGGARVAGRIALICKCAAGVYLNGAGFPNGTTPSPKDSVFPVFAAVGNVDFNFPEVSRLDEALAAAGYPHFLRYFDGPHQWAPPEVAQEALAWFLLVAMKKNLAPRDDAFIAQQRDAEIARAKSFEQSGNLFYAWREYNQAIAAFDGLTDVASLRASASSLASQKDVREGPKRQQRDFEEQQFLTGEITDAMSNFNSGEDDPTKDIRDTKQKIANLRETAAREKKPEKAIILKRAIGDVFVQAMETGGDRLYAKEFNLAKIYYQLAAEANPDSPGPWSNLAVCQAMTNNRKAVFDALRQAKLKSTDMPQFLEWLQSEPAFTPYHDDPQFRALLAN
jgi:tetratricopeptide (TPR) repeat protein